VNAADAIKWITEQKTKNPDKPWFVWLAFNLSHITGKQDPNPMIVPNIDTMDEKSINEMKACGGTFGSAIVGNCTPEMLMRAMTNSMDTIIGKVLDVVNKQDPNTYIIYLGDNGTWMFGPKREFIDNLYITRRGRSKGTAYESGAHVSMAIRGPNIPANTQCNVPIHGVDLFATILEMAGLDIPKMVPDRDNKMVPVDSVSLTPLLFKNAKTLRDPNKGWMLTESINPTYYDGEMVMKSDQRQAAARNGRFYDLVDDPIEEYPLPMPESCANYKSGLWTPANQQWHFCHLQEVLSRESFLAYPAPKDKTDPRAALALAD
jgi:arylsulfatase A-like enzyme